ncbi:MAG TPA: hypothetical protein PLA83_11355 [Deltaproteobacteria bacterium]|jgi:hypothetical protein|nr:hypothetical protein [Deltaproteobacteria bacterium]HQI01803.1 hypothetical protein [Deltaproteobacteria bacterium]HQJ08190.1 hypothetical protein [Deltaproteobacteria bacterium]
MENQSFTSLILLLILFFVIPSVLKFLGKYTMSTKDAQRDGEDAPRPRTLEIPEKIFPRYEGKEQDHPRSGPSESERPYITNEPINPKWF